MFDGTDRFDPENVTPKTMKAIYQSLSYYLDNIVDEIMVPPEDMDPRDWKKMKEGAEVARKLLKKLKKNDTSVFVIDV